MGKGDTQKMEAHFSVVLVEVPQEGLGETATALGEALHLQPEAAKQVLSTAPVVLFRDLAKPEIRALKPKLIELSKRGVEFRITPRPADTLPSVNWPTKPGFAQSGGGELLPSVTFEWQQHAFVCPGCGEAFVIRPIGKPVITRREEAKAPAPTPVPTPKPSPPRAETKAAPPPPKPAPAKVAAKKEVVEEIEEIQEISEPLEVVDEIEEVQEIAEPLEVAEEVEEVEEIQEISDAEPIEEVEEIAEAAGEDLEMIDLDETPKKSASKKPPEKKAAPPPKPEAKRPPEKKPPKKGGDDEEDEEGGEGEITYSVFLSRIPTPDKQSQAAKMIAEIRSCSMGEAKDLAARMVIPVVKDVSKDEAEACLERFKKMKIQGRITKKK